MSTRLSVDIGGTFTDVVLDHDGQLTTTKVLTTYGDPADAVMQGIQSVLAETQVSARAIDLVLHGTTLATNALIERQGAATGLLTTAGHRDVLEMAFENRFEQYDINIDRPVPLIPRRWRRGIEERLAADGTVLLGLNEAQVLSEVAGLVAQGVTSIAVGLLHSYSNAQHEKTIHSLIAASYPDLSVSLSCEVCPEIREYERFSTTVANAYVKPLMSHYLGSLERQLKSIGITARVLMMTSGGGLTTLRTASAYPIRLVESGPAGGALLAASIAREQNLNQVVSFDMGGTTAKVCLIDAAQPLQSRSFEVDRSYRFKKGSGLPVRIPVIEMVEIGAGGGSIASVDALGRINVGPESAGSEPGPACYQRGGHAATVTDADLVLGRLQADYFAGGEITLNAQLSQDAVHKTGQPLALDMFASADAIIQIVEENMATAARAHAGEWGKSLPGRTMIAFGGAAPLHAATLAQKLKLDQVIVPSGAGVGSALGFLLAPIKFEVVRSHFCTLAQFDLPTIQQLLEDMRGEVSEVLDDAGFKGTHEQCHAYMRYAGQGYEVAVEVAARELSAQDLLGRFEVAYAQLYGRIIPNMAIEVLSWTLSQAAPLADEGPAQTNQLQGHGGDGPTDLMTVELLERGRKVPAQLYSRSALGLATKVTGPALIVEAQTTTFVPGGMFCTLMADGALLIVLE